MRTKAPFNGGFCLRLAVHRLVPAFSLAICKYTSTKAQNGAQSHEFIDQVVHVPVCESQFGFTASRFEELVGD